MKDHRKKGHGTGYVIALGFLIVIAAREKATGMKSTELEGDLLRAFRKLGIIAI